MLQRSIRCPVPTIVVSLALEPSIAGVQGTRCMIEEPNPVTEVMVHHE